MLYLFSRMCSRCCKRMLWRYQKLVKSTWAVPNFRLSSRVSLATSFKIQSAGSRGSTSGSGAKASSSDSSLTRWLAFTNVMSFTAAGCTTSQHAWFHCIGIYRSDVKLFILESSDAPGRKVLQQHGCNWLWNKNQLGHGNIYCHESQPQAQLTLKHSCIVLNKSKATNVSRDKSVDSECCTNPLMWTTQGVSIPQSCNHTLLTNQSAKKRYAFRELNARMDCISNVLSWPNSSRFMKVKSASTLSRVHRKKDG